MSFKQTDKQWGNMVIGVSALMKFSGCVVVTFTNLVNLIKGTTYTPEQVLTELRKHAGIFVNGKGDGPGNLMVWPRACAAYGIACDDGVLHKPDLEEDLHDFGGHVVDGNIDLAEACAAALLIGFGAVRVDLDGDGQGDHTITLVGRDEAGNFVCDDPALGELIKLDPNLEGGKETAWDKQPYRAVGFRAVYAKTAA